MIIKLSILISLCVTIPVNYISSPRTAIATKEAIQDFSHPIPETAETKKTKIDESSSQSTSKILPSSSLDTTKSLIMSTFAQDFADIRHMSGFVDKSMLIQAVLNVDRGILLIAPRRFGKSVNIMMLKRFFEIHYDPEALAFNRELFKDTHIEKCESIMTNHFQKYPVMYLDFRSPGSVCSYDAAFKLIRNVVREAYRNHAYLQTSGNLISSQKLIVEEWCDYKNYVTLATTDDEIYEALKNLAEFLFQHHNKKVFVLVDEYDGICSDSVLYIKEEDELQRVIALCVGSLSCLLKPTQFTGKYIDRGIMTGISYLMTMGLSKLTNIRPFKFQEIHIFSPFYGLTVTELKSLLSKLKRESEECTMIDYYNGYKNDILSIWSVMNYLNSESKKVKNYWRDSGSAAKLCEALRIYEIRSIILKLLSDISNSVEIYYFEKIEYINLQNLLITLKGNDPTFENVDIFFNLLLEQGYLRMSDVYEVEGGLKVDVDIPNHEIRLEFHEKLRLFYERVYRINFGLLTYCSSVFDQFSSSTDDNEQYISELFQKLDQLFQTTEFDIINEATFHHVVFLIGIYCEGKCFSEVRCSSRNKKRLDTIIFNSNNVVIILELKFGDVVDLDNKNIKNADAGLKQILKNEYIDAVENEKYKPKDFVKMEYYVLIGLHLSVDKRVSLSVLLNNTNYSKKIDFSPNVVE